MTPGVVAGFSRIGLVEVDAVDATNDTRANNSPFSAAIDVAPAINPEAMADRGQPRGGRHPRRRLAGRDRRARIFAGQGAVIDLGGDMEPITRARHFQYIELGEAGAGSAGGSRAAAHRDAAQCPQGSARRSAGRGSAVPRTCC